MFFPELLELLRRNKQYPNYAAERRIDIFINFFLANILTAKYGEKVNFVAPEFPLKKYESSNRPVKLDYLCAFDKTKQPLFVELKIDALYFNEDQARLYAKRAGSWPVCIETLKDIIEICSMRFSFRMKYFYLINQLLKAELIYFNGENTKDSFNQLSTLAEQVFSQNDKKMFSQDFIKLSRHIRARWNGEAILLYLGPDNDVLRRKIRDTTEGKGSLLDFSQIAELPIRSDMPYGQEFKQLVEFLRILK